MSDSAQPNYKGLLEAVQELSTKYDASAKANSAMATEFNRRKRETRWIAIGVVVVVVIAVCSWLVVRRNDQRTEAERRQHLADQVFSQRESQREGCERQNEVRLTLVSVITIAVGVPAPVPEGLPPALLDLYRQGQERSAQLRQQLLSLPGVQVVDCLAIYPPLPR